MIIVFLKNFWGESRTNRALRCCKNNRYVGSYSNAKVVVRVLTRLTRMGQVGSGLEV